MKPEWGSKARWNTSGRRSARAPRRCGTIAMTSWSICSGALCPSRATGAAIIMAAVNSEAMNEHLKEIAADRSRRSRRAGVRRRRLAPAQWAPHDPRKHHLVAPAALFTGVEPDGERLGLSARQQTQPPGVGYPCRHRPGLCRGLALPHRRSLERIRSIATRSWGVCQCLGGLV